MNEAVAKLRKSCGNPENIVDRARPLEEVMDMDSAICREQAAYCTLLLRKALAPARRAQLEREREDWLILAHRQDAWRAVRLEATPIIEA